MGTKAKPAYAKASVTEYACYCILEKILGKHCVFMLKIIFPKKKSHDIPGQDVGRGSPAFVMTDNLTMSNFDE